MERYVDIDKYKRKLIKEVCEKHCDKDGCDHCLVSKAVDLLFDMPRTIVVHCEDCVYWSPHKIGWSGECEISHVGDVEDEACPCLVTECDDYCKWGKRRDETDS
jgi:hypothetical protein